MKTTGSIALLCEAPNHWHELLQLSSECYYALPEK
jgi:hypothetical protein